MLAPEQVRRLEESHKRVAESRAQERQRVAEWHARQRHGTVCYYCGQDIPAKQPVWRIRAGNGVRIKCRACWNEHHKGPHRHDKGIKDACEGCGRTVWRSPWYARPKRLWCSWLCRRKQTTTEIIARRSRERALDRGDRRCAVCGGFFTPKRSDGLTCSSACRQKRYRQKKGPPELAQGGR